MAANDGWVKDFRADVRRAAGSGWFVQEDRHGQVRLKIQVPGQPAQTAQLPYAWSPKEKFKVFPLITALHQLMTEHGLSLRAAMARHSGSKTDIGTNWGAAVEAFHDHLTTRGSTVKPVTWKRYAEVLDAVVELMASKKPATSGYELIAAVTKRWDPGTRRRQEAVRQAAKFLRFCVQHRMFAALWAPPTDLKELIGMAPAKQLGEISNKTDPLTDLEILRLIEGFPDTPAGRRWADALRLIAEFGLRPVELLHLSVQVDAKTGEPFFLCSYQKRAGSYGRTAPRRLHALPLRNAEGELVAWNLALRWQAGLIELPPLGGGNSPADAVRHYLLRRPYWRHLEATYAERGENIAPYSLRGSYSLRGHQRGIDNGSMAAAMGHSLAVHCASYPWASPTTTAEAFARAQAAEQVKVK